MKDRKAAQCQLALGFWWDSRTLTRCLVQEKVDSYMFAFGEVLTCKTMSLLEMQQTAGKMQRAVMTFPKGAACLIVSMFAPMCGLRLPWQRRRTTRTVRRDVATVMDLLRLNMGKGYYSFADFELGAAVATDASRSRGYTGGGFVSMCGRYDFWVYGSRAARQGIDYLEGDVVVVTVRRLAHLWHGKRIPIFVDNMVFEKSGEAGRARVERLNVLLKELFMLQIVYSFVFEWFWIDTRSNLLADHLSRGRETEFLRDAHGKGAARSLSVYNRIIDDRFRDFGRFASEATHGDALRFVAEYLMNDSESTELAYAGKALRKALPASWLCVPAGVMLQRVDGTAGRTRTLPEVRGVITEKDLLEAQAAAKAAASGQPAEAARAATMSAWPTKEIPTRPTNKFDPMDDLMRPFSLASKPIKKNISFGPKPLDKKPQCECCGSTEFSELIKCQFCPQVLCADCYPPSEHDCQQLAGPAGGHLQVAAYEGGLSGPSPPTAHATSFGKASALRSEGHGFEPGNSSVLECLPSRRGDEEPDECNEETGYHVGPIVHTEFTPGHFTFWCMECSADLEAAPAATESGCPPAPSDSSVLLPTSSASLIPTNAPEDVGGEQGETYAQRALRAAQQPARGGGGVRVRGGKALMTLLLLAVCGRGESARPEPRGDSVADAVAAASYARSSIFDGLPAEFLPQVEQIMDNRLSSSSWQKINTALKSWRAFASERGWAVVIETDDPMRGGKLAAWVTSLVALTTLVYASISKYVWALCTWMTLQHQADPRVAVPEWRVFMAATKVLTFVPSKPHDRWKVENLEKVLRHLDPAKFADVQLAVLLLILFYTFARSETPLSKTREGRDCYDPEEDLAWADVRLRRDSSTRFEQVTEVRFKKVKTDQRMEREEARGEGDWRVVGAVDDPLWDLATWYVLLIKFHGRKRGAAEPFFIDPSLAPDDASPGEFWMHRDAMPSEAWLYRDALAAAHAAQRAAGVPESEIASFHGLRVEAWNLSKRGNGEALSGAHGGWTSKSGRRRYDRFSPRAAQRISQNMLRARVSDFSGSSESDGSGDSPDGDDSAPRERNAAPPASRLSRSQLRPPGAGSSPGPSAGGVQVTAVASVTPVAPAAARKKAPAPAPLATSGPVPPGVALDEFVTFDARPSARRAPVARART